MAGVRFLKMIKLSLLWSLALVVTLTGCASHHYPPSDGMGYRFSTKQSNMVTIMPNIATLQLPDYYSRVQGENSKDFILKAKEIKDNFHNSSALMSIINAAIGNEYCAFICKGAFADTYVYYGKYDLESVKNILKDRIPTFIKRNSFYSTWVEPGQQKEDYGPIYSMYDKWECITFLYDIDFHDGDGAAYKVAIYMHKQGDCSFIVLFEGSRPEEELFMKESKSIIDSFRVLKQ